MMSPFRFTGPLPPERFNMVDYTLGRAARETPQSIGLLVYDATSLTLSETWTFRALSDAMASIAFGLTQLGLDSGARVLIRLPNTSTYALTFFAAIAAGLIPIPGSTQLTDTEADFLLRDSGAALLIAETSPSLGLPNGTALLTPDDIARWLAIPAPSDWKPLSTHASDPAYLIYTSGTTSKPKGVLHAHRAAWGRKPMHVGWYDLRPTDRVLHTGAFNWTYTLGTGLTDPWSVGATAIVAIGEKSPEMWPRLVTESGATLFAAVPTLYRQIAKYASPTRGSFGTLRHAFSAGETPPPDLFDRYAQDYGLALYEAIGMSELSTFISTSPTAPRRKGFIGKPQPGRTVVILPVDGGEQPLPPGEQGLMAAHRSDPALMLGYWQRPSEEAEVLRGEWFIGGDLAVMDPDGYVAHRGRANDIMKALGYRVAPQEVEEVLGRLPGVAEVACAEVSVRQDVSVIGAFVVRHAGSQVSEADVLAAAHRGLATYKQPRVVRFVDALPRTANGKLKRSALKV
jgi:acetyl-CoA synthetase